MEIGPGFGALTEKLRRSAARLVALEVDRRLCAVLSARYGGEVRILEGDALKTDLDALASEHFGGLTPRVCANIPYHITSDLLSRLIETSRYESLLLMTQREVAERITAVPGRKAYGAFTVYARVLFDAAVCFPVPPEAFLPRPAVHSSVILLTRRPEPLVPADRRPFFTKVVRAAFAQRRKTLQNALSAVFTSLSKQELCEHIAFVGLEPSVRGETLGIPEFYSLAERLSYYVEPQ